MQVGDKTELEKRAWGLLLLVWALLMFTDLPTYFTEPVRIYFPLVVSSLSFSVTSHQAKRESVSASGFNYNMIGLESFRPTIFDDQWPTMCPVQTFYILLRKDLETKSFS